MRHEWLEDARSQLAEIDKQLVEILGKRFVIIGDIAKYKKTKKIPMMQQDQVNKVIERSKREAQLYGLSEAFIAKLFECIILEACRVEDAIIGASTLA